MWPIKIPDEVGRSKWFNCLTERAQEASSFGVCVNGVDGVMKQYNRQ